MYFWSTLLVLYLEADGLSLNRPRISAVLPAKIQVIHVDSCSSKLASVIENGR